MISCKKAKNGLCIKIIPKIVVKFCYSRLNLGHFLFTIATDGKDWHGLNVFKKWANVFFCCACKNQQKILDHYTFLGICPPTPPQSQHFALSEKQVLMFFFFLICLLIITLNNYIYKTHTHKKKLSNYYRRSYRAKRNCKKSTTGQWNNTELIQLT